MNLLRRIVTGHDADGRSIVISDEEAPAEGRDLGQLYAWGTEHVPTAVVARAEDIDASEELNNPPRRGLKVFFVEFPPDDGASTDAEKRAYAKHLFASLGPGFTQPDASRYPFMHVTATVDCVIVLSGEVSLLLDEGDPVPLKPFDVVVQQGTNPRLDQHRPRAGAAGRGHGGDGVTRRRPVLAMPTRRRGAVPRPWATGADTRGGRDRPGTGPRS